MSGARCWLAVLSMLLVVCASAAPAGRSTVTLKHFGTAGWEVTDGQTVVLIDPYLSRLNRVIPADDASPTDTRPFFTTEDMARTDTAVVDAHIQRADFLLITHTHFDHALDVPYIAGKTGATVIGTESMYNLARAYGVASDKLIIVRGGEDYEFGAVSIKVIRSLHGVLRRAPFLRRDPNAPLPLPAFPRDSKAPVRIRDFVEGDTLAYLIRIGGRTILAFGSMNYIEREIEGLKPDVALIGAMPERREIYDYTGRLLRALGYPRLVVPTHWDRFNVPYEVSQEPALQRLQSFIAEVKAASPRTKVVVPKYFEPIAVP